MAGFAYTPLSEHEVGSHKIIGSKLSLTKRQCLSGITIVGFSVFVIHLILVRTRFNNVGEFGHVFANPGPDSLYQECLGVSEIGESRVLGGIPGFYTFENLWFHQGAFHLFGEAFPEQSLMMSGRTNLVVHGVETPRPRPDVCFDGTTILNNAGARPDWTPISHYYHFVADYLLGAMAAWSALEPSTPEPKRVIMPWSEQWTDRWGLNRLPGIKHKMWRDQYGISEVIVEGIFPSPAVVERDQWERLVEGDEWIHMERAIFVDRWASQDNNIEASIWGQPSMPAFELHHRFNFLEPMRQRVLGHYDLLPATAQNPCPKIVYIDRQASKRRFSTPTQIAFLQLFKELEDEGSCIFHHVILEDLTVIQQLEMVSDADVMIGIHGNGLTHEIWMPQNSTLIELFPSTSFVRHYQILAKLAGHGYYAINNDTIWTAEDWEKEPGERNPKNLHDYTRIEVSLELIRTILKETLKGKSKACRPMPARF